MNGSHSFNQRKSCCTEDLGPMRAEDGEPQGLQIYRRQPSPRGKGFPGVEVSGSRAAEALIPRLDSWGTTHRALFLRWLHSRKPTNIDGEPRKVPTQGQKSKKEQLEKHTQSLLYRSGTHCPRGNPLYWGRDLRANSLRLAEGRERAGKCW